ncbi:MAG: YggS family pyridoxal phosphate-dependent enzyme [Lachnospiraceae bacterium]|nr:YggS family pyridoxal phosphate-dependent enzyme [Lachnospiraceae bacterium]MDE7052366.1 YggS family pyridoxal phosphate-dependent enzyme [Lachnospiraceae bacterium]
MVKENLAIVEERVKAACDRAGRSYGSVTLVAVSKTKPVRLVEQAYEYGIRQFGENKAQEMKEKYDMLPKNIEWHFIGHLQTNKIKYVLGRATLIHSVDSLHLAEAIEAECVKKGLEADVLVEVNVAQEETKSGIKTEEAEGLVKDIARLPHVHVKGLMTIAPFVENAGNNRMIFRTLKELSVDIAGKNIDNVSMNILSMGMTNDYEVAIEEGATHIRVGTAIFGERNIAI